MFLLLFCGVAKITLERENNFHCLQQLCTHEKLCSLVHMRNYALYQEKSGLLYLCFMVTYAFNVLTYFSEGPSPTVLLAQSLKAIHGFQMLWPSALSHVNFDLRKLLPGQREMTLPPIVQHLTLQILLQAPPRSLNWYQQVSFCQEILKVHEWHCTPLKIKMKFKLNCLWLTRLSHNSHGTDKPVALRFPIDFCGGRKTGEPKEKPLDQGRKPAITQPTRHELLESNPSYIGGKHVLATVPSLLRPGTIPTRKEQLHTHTEKLTSV